MEGEEKWMERQTDDAGKNIEGVVKDVEILKEHHDGMEELVYEEDTPFKPPDFNREESLPNVLNLEGGSFYEKE